MDDMSQSAKKEDPTTTPPGGGGDSSNKTTPLLEFTPIYAFGLLFCIITYVTNFALDFILAVTYLLDGYYWYCVITVILIFFPTLIVQIFSIRWHHMDDDVNGATWIIHGSLLGVLHRYLVVIANGIEASNTQDYVDYQRFYQHISDVCMLRLFGSFLEAAPQLVFQLYVLLERAEWPAHRVIWTGLSAIASTVSVGWGIAEYSTILRMVRAEKQKMTWTGRILQTVWRFGMLAARFTALIMLAQAIHEWLIIVLFVHWFAMTVWVIFQNTDFCSNVWEERLYNAVVGVIYCFAFFNLKEGNSRWRAFIFYLIIITENLVFALVYVLTLGNNPDVDGYNFGVTGFVVIVFATILGLSSMLLYYRYFHPAGPINPFGSKDRSKDGQPKSSSGPDFEIEDVIYGKSSPPPRPPRPPPRKQKIQYSRSFKDTCPPANRLVYKRPPPPTPDDNGGDCEKGTTPSISPGSVKNECGRFVTNADSAYGTDSNRTASRSTTSPPHLSPVEEIRIPTSNSGSSPGYNNKTYASTEKEISTTTHRSWNSKAKNKAMDETSEFSQCSQGSADSRITVIERNEMAEPKKLLKRSPIVKDVTSSFAEVTPLSSIGQNIEKKDNDNLTAPLTIIIPNISHQAFARSSCEKNDGEEDVPKLADRTIPLEKMTPMKDNHDFLAAHDYENLALVNINRAALGVTHWRTYSDMANDNHDESTAYERKKVPSSDYSNQGSLQYYDIYPLSREMKEKLYRNIENKSGKPALENSNLESSDTYEPIEVYSGHALTSATLLPPASTSTSTSTANGSSNDLPLTVIHHNGKNMMTKQVVSLDNLKDALREHDKIPMDDQNLYLLTPLRLLTPIIEESSEYDSIHKREELYGLGAHNRNPSQISTSSKYQSGDHANYANFHRSLLSVISEALHSPPNDRRAGLNVKHLEDSYGESSTSSPLVQSVTIKSSPNFPKKQTIYDPNTTSSLVNTIDEIRNNSFGNLFFGGSNSPLEPKLKNQIKNSVPSPELSCHKKTLKPLNLKPECQGSKVPDLPDKPVSAAPVGSRKNILELAGTGNNILNTPKRPSKSVQHQREPSIINASSSSMSAGMNSSLHSVSKNFMPLSPSSKYETPTPPLKVNEFVRNSVRGRQATRRKFSMIREQFETSRNSNCDLYQNISDDLLNNDVSQISKIVPSPDFTTSDRNFEMSFTDDRYENLQRGWATSSTRQVIKMQHHISNFDKENQCPKSMNNKPQKSPTLMSTNAYVSQEATKITAANNSKFASLSSNSQVFNRK